MRASGASARRREPDREGAVARASSEAPSDRGVCQIALRGVDARRTEANWRNWAQPSRSGQSLTRFRSEEHHVEETRRACHCGIRRASQTYAISSTLRERRMATESL